MRMHSLAADSRQVVFDRVIICAVPPMLAAWTEVGQGSEVVHGQFPLLAPASGLETLLLPPAHSSNQLLSLSCGLGLPSAAVQASSGQHKVRTYNCVNHSVLS